MEFGRKLYSLGEIYTILYKGIGSAPHMTKAKRKGEMTSEFIERIMLAVTEVNGCPLCSYAHTKMALEAGMNNEEIHNMLSGVMEDVPEEDLQAVMFAQHYADSRGYPSRESWDRVVENYGIVKAKGILGAIRAIMMGNALAIPWGSFFNRFKGQPDERSNLGYELGVMVIGSIMIPVALVHALLASMKTRS